ncbi:hypothetical protein Bca52824_009215 [Brassica carinata]|uniref:RING-type domain-containing protein n=1 Tax=Brassica carinata TaxID=52824 RepID=A0A8X8B9Z9_BRACI|nr:hypothetical protein Bca52824_009215 [Brassica carinata]
MMLDPVTHPTDVCIGPNSSILVEPNSIFYKSVKVERLGGSESGLELFGFYTAPHVYVANWSESRLVSLSHRSYKGWPYYLNKGASLNISYNVKPEGSSVRVVVENGMSTNYFNALVFTEMTSHGLLEEPLFFLIRPPSNLIKGYGVIQLNISNSGSYHLNVANPNYLKDVEVIITLVSVVFLADLYFFYFLNFEMVFVQVELDIDVRAVLYDTKEPPFYKCDFSKSACTFNTMPFVGTSIVLTSPSHRPGVLAEEQEWFIRISYQARWTSYAIVTGLVICFIMLALKLNKWLQHYGEEKYVMDDDSSTISLLVNKDDDVSSMCSWTESVTAYDADREDFSGNESEASYGNRTRCAICFDTHRDCFFLPCGHCFTCYQCGTKIAEAAGKCPICRKKIKNVKLIYTV